MGKKSSSEPIPQQISAPEIDIEGILKPMFAMLGEQVAMTQDMVAQNDARMQALSTPDVTDLTTVDWEEENKTLQSRIDADIIEEKRKGVLGTILTNYDDEDDPLTVGSLLTAGD